jgi:hypothetical protein
MGYSSLHCTLQVLPMYINTALAAIKSRASIAHSLQILSLIILVEWLQSIPIS